MRISVIASSYPRFKGDGVAPFVKSISESLHKRGHKIEVVAPYDVSVEADPEAQIKVHRFRYIWPKKGHIMGHARSLSADVKLRPLTVFLLPFYVLAATLKLMSVSKKMDAQVIHAHWVLPNGLPGAIVSKLLNIPLIISLHGSDIFMSDKNILFRAVARWVFSQSSYVTACSQELFDRAKKINDTIHIKLIPWGADPDIFKPHADRTEIREKYGWVDDEIIIATLGRFVYKKGFERLITIVPDLPHEAYHVRVVIGGSGPLEQDFKDKVHRLNLQKVVSFPGQVLWHEVPNFLAAADIFVLPSQRDMAGNLDGLPTVLLEAMACGLPCVASDVGGVSLVIDHTNNGFLFAPEDNASLRDYTIKLVTDKACRELFGQRSRASVVEKYNWNNVAIAFEDLFTGSIESNK